MRSRYYIMVYYSPYWDELMICSLDHIAKFVMQDGIIYEYIGDFL